MHMFLEMVAVVHFKAVAEYMLSGLAIFAALMLVLSRNPVHSILYLVGTFFCISVHYVLLNAQFLAVANIIVYAGAIMVLFLFVVMLMNLQKAATWRSYLKQRPLSVILSFAFLALLLLLFVAHRDQVFLPESGLDGGTLGLTQSLGEVLFSVYGLPFELTVLLFLTAIIAAVILARKSKSVK